MESLEFQTQKYTFEEYLELERNSKIRHEFYYGEIFSMAGTTIVHNDIVYNINTSLKKAIKKNKKKCRVNSEAVKVQISEKNHYTYPDVVLRCDETEDDNLTIKKPILIVEVLSDSTRKYDTSEKFKFYKQIQSLKHYILVEQDFCFITCYTKDNDFWYHQAYTKFDDIIKLEYIDINIQVKDIYEEIVFPKKNRPS